MRTSYASSNDSFANSYSFLSDCEFGTVSQPNRLRKTSRYLLHIPIRAWRYLRLELIIITLLAIFSGFTVGVVWTIIETDPSYSEEYEGESSGNAIDLMLLEAKI